MLLLNRLQTGEKMNASFIKQAVEQAVKTFVTAFLGAWVAAGSDFDALTDSANLKIGVTAVAASIAISMGLKKVGSNKDSVSVL
jgi:hypothetical protein